MLANKVDDNTTTFEDGLLYLVRGTDNASVDGDDNYYDSKAQNLTVFNSGVQIDIIGVQILCNI